jgi:1,4-dihydroxy-2-naphthoate octaprenyltransferase
MYFIVVRGWLILTFMIAGALAIRFYTAILARWLAGELTAGVTLGSLVVMGSYYALTGVLPAGIIVISIPPGILTALLLFLNEFPDADADREGGRYHLVIHYGRKKSSRIYAAGLFMVYLIILTAPFIADVPRTVLVGLATLPLAFETVRRVFKYFDDMKRLVPALGLNVGIVILTDLLLAVGFFL